jgi:hypothetical protein
MLLVLALVLVIFCASLALGLAARATAEVRSARRRQERREAPATLEGGGSHLSSHREAAEGLSERRSWG